jgi:hypothetical protein
MSSHREAPAISKDPVADNTDLYAFRSPDNPDMVTIIANYLPLEGPAGGPNFFEFGDDVMYEIHIDNDGDSEAEIIYQFSFRVEITNPNTFLYNTGPITSLTSPNWNRRQYMTVARVTSGEPRGRILAENLSLPPCNVGQLSIPNYASLAQAAIHKVGNARVFAGQRREGFYVDLGSIFDLGDLLPLQALNVFAMGEGLKSTGGIDSTAGVNVHTIAIEVPITDLTANGSMPMSVTDPTATIGIWASANRQKVRVLDISPAERLNAGPFNQVSRLGNPLFNEVIVPMSQKDLWNSLMPYTDSRFAEYVLHPELAGLLPVLYPGTASSPIFPNLAALVKSGAPRADLEAILLTGIPSGLIPGFQNYTGSTLADQLRLNLAIPPATTGSNPISSFKGNILGVLGGDLAGYPNGRRVFDDVVAIALRAVAGAVYGLVDKSYTPDAAVGLIGDFSDKYNGVPKDLYQDSFPYLADPIPGSSMISAPVA